MDRTAREKMSMINQAVESYRKVPDSIGRIFDESVNCPIGI